ncbi:MAG TPA: sigma-70 family RNA polymerase sigma factor [Solirubrobacteraceae bacterium]|jgi:RNA polymerase sigma-70 factor (ECF subfamily)
MLRTSFAIERRESDLVVAARGGDVGAFEDLIGPHADRLYSVVLVLLRDSGEAEDVLQETLLRAWRGIGRFRGRAMIFTWLYRIAVNESNRALERRSRRASAGPVDDAVAGVAAPAHHGPARRAEQHALQQALGDAIAGLAPQYRAALVLRDVEGLSTREAAQITGVGEAAFKSRLHHARQKVRAVLGDAALLSAAS